MTNVNDRNWKVLIRPNRPVVQAGYDSKRKAKLAMNDFDRFKAMVKKVKMNAKIKAAMK